MMVSRDAIFQSLNSILDVLNVLIYIICKRYLFELDRRRRRLFSFFY